MRDILESVAGVDRRKLASLLEEGGEGDRLWRPEELAAILRHQLSAPLHVDLVALERGQAARVRTAAESQGLLLKSFADLLHHPNPPRELLEMTKQFAKNCRISPRSPIPRDIASVLYFASIAAALVRCQERISTLDATSLRKGFQWVLDREWVDRSTRALVQKALRAVVDDEDGT
jgi:anti-sigma factor RsiW